MDNMEPRSLPLPPGSADPLMPLWGETATCEGMLREAMPAADDAPQCEHNGSNPHRARATINAAGVPPQELAMAS